jgi:hypothetical protein
MGFKDDDLSTPKHDEIVLALRDHLLSGNVYRLFKQPIPLNRDMRIDELREQWSQHVATPVHFRHTHDTFPVDPAHLPEYTLPVVRELVLERPIHKCEKTYRYRHNNSPIIGFADLWASVVYDSDIICGHFDDHRFASSKKLDDNVVCKPDLEVSHDTIEIIFEVKTTIPSFGELLRQLAIYKTYSDSNKSVIVVVSPDARWANDLRVAGYRFLPYPFNNEPSTTKGETDGY